MTDTPKNIREYSLTQVHDRVQRALDFFIVASNAMKEQVETANPDEIEAVNQEMLDMLKQCNQVFAGRPEYMVYLVLISLVVDAVETTEQSLARSNLPQKSNLVN